MSEASLRCVVDASAGIKLFVEEDYSEQAQALFSQLAADPPAEIHVPDLFFIECANILLKYTRRFGRPLVDSQADVAALGELALRATPTASLMEAALLLANEKNLTAYDACYAVLAQSLEFPLITADEALLRAVSWAVWIGDFAV